MENISFEFPQLRDEDITTFYAQLRPFRETGPRIEKQTIKDKTIVHNYGHGGAGISIAPRCSFQAVGLASDILKPNTEVAIIGSGISGLMVAHRILEHEPKCKVTIYAEQVASYCNKNNQKLITSQIAPGFWLPYKYGLQNEEIHTRWAHESFEWYKQMSKSELYQRYIKQCDFYDLSDQQEDDPTTKYLCNDVKTTMKNVEFTINGKTKMKGYYYRTFRVDVQPFLLVFRSQLISKGVRFVQQKITKESLFSLKQNIAFNCSALGSRQLFGDTKMIPKKGHIIEYKNPNPKQFNYLLRINIGKRRIAYYMHQSRILSGLTLQEQDNRDVDPIVIADIKDVHKLALEKMKIYGPRAKL